MYFLLFPIRKQTFILNVVNIIYYKWKHFTIVPRILRKGYKQNIDTFIYFWSPRICSVSVCLSRIVSIYLHTKRSILNRKTLFLLVFTKNRSVCMVRTRLVCFAFIYFFDRFLNKKYMLLTYWNTILRIDFNRSFSYCTVYYIVVNLLFCFQLCWN